MPLNQIRRDTECQRPAKYAGRRRSMHIAQQAVRAPANMISWCGCPSSRNLKKKLCSQLAEYYCLITTTSTDLQNMTGAEALAIGGSRMGMDGGLRVRTKYKKYESALRREKTSYESLKDQVDNDRRYRKRNNWQYRRDSNQRAKDRERAAKALLNEHAPDNDRVRDLLQEYEAHPHLDMKKSWHRLTYDQYSSDARTEQYISSWNCIETGRKDHERNVAARKELREEQRYMNSREQSRASRRSRSRSKSSRSRSSRRSRSRRTDRSSKEGIIKRISRALSRRRRYSDSKSESDSESDSEHDDRRTRRPRRSEKRDSPPHRNRKVVSTRHGKPTTGNYETRYSPPSSSTYSDSVPSLVSDSRDTINDSNEGFGDYGHNYNSTRYGSQYTHSPQQQGGYHYDPRPNQLPASTIPSYPQHPNRPMDLYLPQPPIPALNTSIPRALYRPPRCPSPPMLQRPPIPEPPITFDRYPSSHLPLSSPYPPYLKQQDLYFGNYQ
jgi:hypothetical protein